MNEFRGELWDMMASEVTVFLILVIDKVMLKTNDILTASATF